MLCAFLLSKTQETHDMRVAAWLTRSRIGVVS
jgi:hypothetical protein